MKPTSDCDVVLVGDELLKGERADSHLGFLGAALARHGARIGRALVVQDDVAQIERAVRESIASARFVIVTGGLGPTDDDITRDGVAAAAGLPLEFNEPTWRWIEGVFSKRGKTATPNNRRQAFFPRGAEILPNGAGTAPGFRIGVGESTVFVLPGPPAEMRPMVESRVLPALRDTLERGALRVETFRTTGVGESTLIEAVKDDLSQIKAYRVSSLPSITGVDIILTQGSASVPPGALDFEAEAFDAALRGALGPKYYERGTRSLSNVVVDLLRERSETVSIAESLTGGWIGKRLTDIPGASACFLADLVTYGDDAKVNLLGVAGETLSRFGAVSEETCREMAVGARHRTGSAYGLATTGIAGPEGGAEAKPVGLTFIGLSWDGGCRVDRRVYAGRGDDVERRDAIRRQACQGALWLLFDRLHR